MSPPTLHIPSQADSTFYTMLVKITSLRKEANPPFITGHVYRTTCVVHSMKFANNRVTAYISKNPLIQFQNKQSFTEPNSDPIPDNHHKQF